jgi:flagellar basal-body rod protein FlgB
MMFPSLVQSTTIPLLEQVVRFAQARHGILAGNLANLDTPGYRVRDLSPELFEAHLKKAIAYRRSHPGPVSPGEAAYDTFHSVKDAMKGLLYHDESDGTLEHQIAEIAKNQMKHNLALTIMTSQFRVLQAAISEQVT